MKPSTCFPKTFSVYSHASIFSYDMRQKGGRHWKDNRTLGNRAFFHYKETGMRSETGAMQIASFLTIEALRPEDTGFYRCRVDFKEAPTKNTKIHLNLIGKKITFIHGLLGLKRPNLVLQQITNSHF